MKWAGPVASKGVNEYKIFVRNFAQGIDHFGNPGVYKKTLRLEK